MDVAMLRGLKLSGDGVEADDRDHGVGCNF
jgi:hypothetical protein